MYTLHFADDQVVIAQAKEDAECVSKKLKEGYQNWGLTLNVDKTKCLCGGGPTEELQLEEDIKVQAFEEYVYLGVKFGRSGRCEREISSMTSIGKRATGALNSILCGNTIMISVKRHIYNAILKSVMLYGREEWLIRRRYEQRIVAIEMDYWRSAARISCLDTVRNERVREIMGID
jgi:hypothetical protein